MMETLGGLWLLLMLYWCTNNLYHFFITKQCSRDLTSKILVACTIPLYIYLLLHSAYCIGKYDKERYDKAQQASTSVVISTENK